MCARFYLFCFALFLIDSSDCYRNYRVMLRSVGTEFVDKKILVLHELAIKKLNRTYSVLNINGTFKTVHEKAFVRIQVYHERSNSFYPTYLNRTYDCCYALENVDKIKHIKIVTDLLYNDNTRVPEKCPIKPGNYYMKQVHVFEEKLPAFFLPAGRFKFEFTFSKEYDTRYFAKGFIIFEVVNMVTRRQQIT